MGSERGKLEHSKEPGAFEKQKNANGVLSVRDSDSVQEPHMRQVKLLKVRSSQGAYISYSEFGLPEMLTVTHMSLPYGYRRGRYPPETVLN